MCQASAYCSLISRLRVSYMRDGSMNQLSAWFLCRVAFELSLPNQGSYLQEGPLRMLIWGRRGPQLSLRSAFQFHRAQVQCSKSIYIDQSLWPGKPHIQRRHQALTTGKNFGLKIAICQEREHFIQGFNTNIIKCCWFHEIPSPFGCSRGDPA